MDPPFTRLIKLDILTSLALDPPSIETVLKELRTYVQLHHNSDEYTDDDTTFVCAAVQAVGRVAEMARIVFARHSGDRGGARCAEADTIALNCLYGLVTFSQAADNEVIVGETVTVMQRILQMLQSDRRLIEDPNQVRDRALQRILLLLVNTLSHVIECDVESHEDEEDSIDVDDVVKLDHVTLILPPIANASAIWLMGECLASLSCCGVMPLGGFDSEGRAKLRMELIRLLVRSFVDLDVPEKEQAIHFASKILLSKDGTNNQEVPLCEQLLAMGRLDADPDVRDRARFESGVIHLFLGLLHDSDGLDSIPMALQNTKRLNLEDAKHIFLSRKPSPSYLPLECPNINQAFGLPTNGTDRDREGTFRFGTLSSLVGHRARSAYLQLPTWAKKNSLSSLRDPPEDKKDDTTAGERQDSNQGSFYESSGDDDSSSSESASTSSSTSNSASDTSSSDSEISEEPKRVEQRTGGVIISTANVSQRIRPGNPHDTFSALQAPNQVDNNTDESSSSESDDGDSSDESFNSNSDPMLSSGFGTLLPTGTTGKRVDSIGQSVADDMKDLVFAPAVLSSAAPPDVSLERDSGEWVVFIRSEHSSGLSMEGRYLRGETKAKQAQAMGLAAEKPTIVCLQVRFENKKAIGATSIRHIRIIQRSSSTSSSTIGPRNIVLPLEISELPCGRKVECMIGIDFSGVSDREGSLLAKLEVKFGSTGASVDLKPSICDLLLHCTRSIEQFDAAFQRMHGFNRVETNFSVSESSRLALSARLLARAALTGVPPGANGGKSNDNEIIRWAGTLPSSADPIYVLTRCSASSGQGTLVVCCEHALVANAVMNVLKRAISE